MNILWNRSTRKDQKSFELKLKTACSERGVNLKDVGCGTSQILPIIVQSQMTQKESLIIIEQPEVHLHPKTQAELADFFSNIATDKNRFLIETHSDYLIERFRYHIANGDIQPEDLFIYYIEQDATSKSSKVTRIEINSKGQYLNMPQDYIANFRLKEMKNITSTILKNLTEKERKPAKRE
jgi:predicted ATPase